MASGNIAIRDASKDGRSILLFEEAPAGLRFNSEVVYEGHYVKKAPDAGGAVRDAIVFVRRPLGDVEDALSARLPQSGNIEDLRRRAYEAAGIRQPRVGGAPRSVYDRSADAASRVSLAPRLACRTPAGSHCPTGRRNGLHQPREKMVQCWRADHALPRCEHRSARARRRVV